MLDSCPVLTKFRNDELVCQPPGAATASATDLGAETTEINFLVILEPGSPRSQCWQGWFLLRPLSLAHLLPVSSHGPPSMCV